MRFATGNEIEYLGAIEGTNGADSNLVHEMRQRLDALRRFDQSFYEADCRPYAGSSNSPPSPPNKAS